MRRALPAVALVLAACSPDFDPASRIEKLRVVAIRAEPPEIDPAGVQTADLTSLVLRADDAATTRTTTVVHLACVPAVGDDAPTYCEMLQNLGDPAVKLAEVARAGCAAGSADPAAAGPAALAGFEVCVDGGCGPASAAGQPLPPARVGLPAGFTFSPAPPPEIAASPQRREAWTQRVAAAQRLGVQAVDVAFAVDATPDELVAGVGTACAAGDLAGNLARLWAAREHVLSLKRVAVRGPQSPNPANRNPAVDGIVASGATLEPAGVTTLARGVLALAPVLPAGAAGQPEPYVELDAAGLPIAAKTEEWVYSWFSTAGELKDLHTRSVTKPDEWTVWSAGPARVVVVVRDLRGGTAWAVRDVVLAP